MFVVQVLDYFLVGGLCYGAVVDIVCFGHGGWRIVVVSCYLVGNGPGMVGVKVGRFVHVGSKTFHVNVGYGGHEIRLLFSSGRVGEVWVGRQVWSYFVYERIIVGCVEVIVGLQVLGIHCLVVVDFDVGIDDDYCAESLCLQVLNQFCWIGEVGG